MNNVVRNENSKRKLDWKAEEALRISKKRDSQRRDNRKLGREVKLIGEEE